MKTPRAVHLVLFALLAASACGSETNPGDGGGGGAGGSGGGAGGSGQGSPGPSGGLVIPPPAKDAPRNVWGLADVGIPAGARPLQVESAQGVSYASVKAGENDTGLYRLDPQELSWAFVTKGPGFQGQTGELVLGPGGQLYLASGQKVQRLDGNVATALPDAPKGAALVAGHPEADRLVAFVQTEAGLGLSSWKPGDSAWTEMAAPTKELPELDPTHASAVRVTSDGSAWMSVKWAIRDTKGQAGAVFRFRPGATVWEDATYNLRQTNDAGQPTYLLNMTGNGWGPFGSIQYGPGGKDLFGTTEQGLFALDISSQSWEQVAYSWGGGAPHASEPYLIFGADRITLIGSRQLSFTVGQTDLYPCERRTFPDVTAPDAKLLVSIYRAEKCSPASGVDEAGEVSERLITLKLPDTIPWSSRDLTATYAGYQGGDGDDEAVGVELAADEGSVIEAVNRAGKALVRRLAPDGQEIASLELSGKATDLALGPGDAPVLVGEFGLALVAPSLATTSTIEGNFERVAVAADGRIVTLAGATVRVHDASGAVKVETTLQRSNVEDVAISSATGLVYVVGFDNQKREGVPVQVPFLVAHDVEALNSVWKTWGFDPKDLANDMADGRLYRATIGRDGQLYVLGETAGGNSVFRWNGRDLASPTLVTTDLFSSLTNTADEHKAYYARLDPQSGAVSLGQVAVPRLSSGKGNTFRVEHGAIAADEAGRVLVGGLSAYQMAGRNLNYFIGQKLDAYDGGDSSLLLVSADFRARLRWTTFSRAKGAGPVSGVALGTKLAAALTTLDQGDHHTTDGSTAANPAKDDQARDAHLVIFAP